MFNFRGMEPFAESYSDRMQGQLQPDDEEHNEEEPEPMDEDEDGSNGGDMDVGDDGLFEFPTPAPLWQFFQNGQTIAYDGDSVPKSFPLVSPQVLQALESIKQTTGAQKAQFCFLKALPLPIEASPVVGFFQAVVPTGADCASTMPRYTNWMLSMFKLAQIMELISAGAVPVPPTTDPDRAKEKGVQFWTQVQRYKRMHDARIAELHEAANQDIELSLNDILQQFVSYLEDFSFYYLNSMERFVYETIIEPHNAPHLRLEHFLTRRTEQLPMRQCANEPAMRQLVSEFFKLKVMAVKDDEREKPAPRGYFNILNPNLTGPLLWDFLDRSSTLAYFLFLDRQCIIKKVLVYFCFLAP